MLTLQPTDSFQKVSSSFTKILKDEGVDDETIENEAITEFLQNGYSKSILRELSNCFGSKYDEIMRNVIADSEIEAYFKENGLSTFRSHILLIFSIYAKKKMTQDIEDRLYQSFLLKGARCISEFSEFIEPNNFEKLCLRMIQYQVPSYLIFDFYLGTSKKIKKPSLADLIKHFQEMGITLNDYIRLYPNFVK